MEMETIKYGEKELYFTGLITKNKKIYQGSILKVDYVEAPSNIFETMKKNGDKEIYFLIGETFDYFGFNLISVDNDNYWIIKDLSADIPFLRYLIEKDCLTVIGNTANPDDKQMYMEIIQGTPKENLEKERQEVTHELEEKLKTPIGQYIGNFHSTLIDNNKDSFSIEIFYYSNFEDDEERKVFRENIEDYFYSIKTSNKRFKIRDVFRMGVTWREGEKVSSIRLVVDILTEKFI